MSKKPESSQSESHNPATTSSKPALRFDRVASIESANWLAFAQTPGIGVAIMDAQGRLLYVNDTTAVLFSGTANVEYFGKTIADFHPPEFVKERLELVRRVLKENRPLSIRHIYLGNAISSTVWPLRDRTPPFDRVLVISRPGPIAPIESRLPNSIETVTTEYIGLGPLNVLTRRELEVLVLLGHGLSVPQTAKVLHRSPKTIERHKDSIGKKLSFHSQAELVYLVTSLGLELSDTHLRRYQQD